MKVEVDVLGFPSLIVLINCLCGHTATLNMASVRELRRCVKVEVDVLVYTAYGLCGHKATLNMASVREIRSCVKVEVTVLGSLSLMALMVSVDVKQH